MHGHFRVYIFIVLFIFAFISNAYTKKNKLNDYHKEVVIGETLTDDFSSSFELQLEIDSNNRSVNYKHNYVERNAVHGHFPEHLNYLEFSFFPEVSEVKRCSNFILNKHITYIRYVFRLLTISYLFETMKDFKSIKAHSCSLEWKSLFSKCRPKNLEMKKFLRRIRPVYLNAFKRKIITPLSADPLGNFKKAWCPNGECSFIDDKEKICKKSRKLIINICSENDEIYGLSFIPEAARIIKISNVMNILNREGQGVGCIDRFVSLYKKSEAKHLWLKKIIPVLFNKYVSMRARRLEGNLFLAGALREFDEKGLDNFLFALQPEKPKPKRQKVIRPISEIIQAKVVRATPAPILVKVKKASDKTVIKTEKKDVIKISEFELKAKFRRERDLSKVPIDMKKFSNDFLFDRNTIKKYNKELKVYYTRTALLDMKAFDKLGSKVEPLRLRFLKFLIETDKHQGLYNIQAVLGEKFYILNDLESKEMPELIRLVNSEKTKYKWQIYILSD